MLLCWLNVEPTFDSMLDYRFPSATQQRQNICITFVQRQRLQRLANILQMLYKCFVFAG